MKVVDTLNRENKEIKSRIFDEEILIANGNYSWEPSESVKARVEVFRTAVF